MNRALAAALSVIALLASDPALAVDDGFLGVSVSIDDAQTTEVSRAMQVLALLTVLSLAPSILIMLTAFTRIVIVLAFLRHAFGMQQTPPNIVIVSLALFLTLFTMMPVIGQINERAYQPYVTGEMPFLDAVAAAELPLRDFMLRQTRERDLAFVIEASGAAVPESPADVPFTSLMPAFMLSELQTAFQIGFIIFLPFLVVDLVVASVLMSVGMIMVPPMTISLPIKVLMFVMIEGWLLVAQSLVASFG